MAAVQPATTYVNAALNIGRVAQTRAVRLVPAGVDDVAVGKADRHVEAARAELLEVGRFVRLDEGLMGRGAVECIGLQPFLPARDAVRTRTRNHFVQAGVEVGDDRLTFEWRLGHAIRLEVRAGRNHAHEAIAPRSDRARILPGKGVQGPGERIAHRLVEHVVGDLAGGIAESARLVEQLQIEAAETRLIRRKARHAHGRTTGVMLAVQRVVVGEHERRNLGGRERCLFQRDPDRGLARCDQRSGDLRAAHGVAAVASARREAGAIVRHLKLPENSGSGRCFHRAAGTGQRRIDAVTG